jgi:hypothetical protein
MSDKKQEAIEKIVGAYMPRTDEDFNTECKLVNDILRSHGWVHLDDVVEEKNFCEDVTSEGAECPTESLQADTCEGCEHNRPATVRDLIGRE